MPSVISKRKTPTIQVSSRGNLYAPKRKTCTMWIRTIATMKFEPHPCIARMNQPKVTSWFKRLQTAPSLACRRYVNQGQQDSSNELKKEDRERSAAEHIEPARCVARHGMLCRVTNGSGQLQPLVKPLPDLSDHAH